MAHWFRSRLLWSTIAALLVVSLVPLVLVGLFALNEYESRTNNMIDTSTALLDETSLERLESQGAGIAFEISSFLRQRENDLTRFAALEPDAETYLAFAQARQNEFWTVDGFTGDEVRLTLPLYREIAFIDPTGQEVIRLEHSCFPYPYACEYILADELADISDPAQTTFGGETYFAAAQALDEGEIYVGRPIGRYVPVNQSYKGAQYLQGQRFQGLVRFITPVYEDGERLGYAMLALDHTHILSFIEHVDPTADQPLPAVDPRADNIVYIIGEDGNAIAHVQHENIAGVDAQGDPVPPFSADNRFQGPGNFYNMGFLSPVFPQIMQQSANRSQGSISRFEVNTAGESLPRSLAYAVIPYFTGQNYDTNRGFGLVIVSTDFDARSVETDVLSAQLENDLNDLLGNLGTLFSVMVVVVGLTAILFAQGVVAPVQDVTRYARKMQAKELTESEIHMLRGRKGKDEVALLARSFGDMAAEVNKREAEISRLLSQTDEALARRVKDLNVLERIGQQLTAVLDLDAVLDLTAEALAEHTNASSVRVEIYPETEGAPALTRQVGEVGADDMRGLYIVPMMVNAREIGRFTMRANDHTFDEAERTLARQLGDWVSVAVNNARLFAFTQQQQAELAQRNEEVMEANRLKSEFLATMSHELRTPLNAIIGFLGIIMMSGELNERNTFLAKRARINSKRLLELINDILDISRIEAGRLKIYPTDVKVAQLIERIRDHIEVLAEEKSLGLSMHIADDVPEVVQMDEDGLTKIITNLLSNAIKFTEKGHVNLDISRDDDALKITVTDTGIGIPAHMHEVIFESFRQVDGSSTRVHGGSGLGLAITRHICDAMYGSIQLDSTVGVGTTFSVRLPLQTTSLVKE